MEKCENMMFSVVFYPLKFGCELFFSKDFQDVFWKGVKGNMRSLRMVLVLKAASCDGLDVALVWQYMCDFATYVTVSFSRLRGREAPCLPHGSQFLWVLYLSGNVRCGAKRKTFFRPLQDSTSNV